MLFDAGVVGFLLWIDRGISTWGILALFCQFFIAVYLLVFLYELVLYTASLDDKVNEIKESIRFKNEK